MAIFFSYLLKQRTADEETHFKYKLIEFLQCNADVFFVNLSICVSIDLASKQSIQLLEFNAQGYLNYALKFTEILLLVFELIYEVGT
jgi:hypothetical protein